MVFGLLRGLVVSTLELSWAVDHRPSTIDQFSISFFGIRTTHMVPIDRGWDISPSQPLLDLDHTKKEKDVM